MWTEDRLDQRRAEQTDLAVDVCVEEDRLEQRRAEQTDLAVDVLCGQKIDLNREEQNKQV